ncbi:MAG: hypothetical protein PHE55_15995 [Methylococcaceae bacterium]|nr:hypothetical protein [Methylococcaceae bacterium]
MKHSPFSFALATAGLALSHSASAHVCNVDLSAPGYAICGDAPYYNVYQSTATASGTTITAVAPASLPAALRTKGSGSADCPVGYYSDLAVPTATTYPTAYRNPADGQYYADPGFTHAVYACTYGSAGLNSFSGNGWISGTTKQLGDSHNLHGGVFFTFSTTKPSSTVTITFKNNTGVNGATPLDPAFSLYAHTLPDDGHDDNPYDPLNPNGNNCGQTLVNAADEVPGMDPGVPKYLFTQDPVTFACTFTLNPAWATWKYYYDSLKALGFYAGNGPYRDTLNFTNTGGLTGIQPTPDVAKNPFLGQFNAINNWSMANGFANPADPKNFVGWNSDGTRYLLSTFPDLSTAVTWSELAFIAARNVNGAGVTETLTLLLPQGIYTIAAAGAKSGDTALHGGDISVKIQ